MTTKSHLSLFRGSRRWPVSAALLVLAHLGTLHAEPMQLYSHGEPTNAEQYALELLNGATPRPSAGSRRHPWHSIRSCSPPPARRPRPWSQATTSATARRRAPRPKAPRRSRAG